MISPRIFIPAFLMMLVCCGCGQKTQNVLDTTALEKSFHSAEPVAKAVVEEAIAAIRSTNYANAVVKLQKLALDEKLPANQREVCKEMLTQIWSVMPRPLENPSAAPQK